MWKKIIIILITILLGFTIGVYSLPGDTGYEEIDSETLHIWNLNDHYYFNRTSGIQLTNHYQQYWTRNVLCVGYFDGETWNKIYCADELPNFNEILDSDDETYVNITYWRDISYLSYDFRLALNYYLEANDTRIKITPYVRNLGIDIPFELGFAWKITDIKIAHNIDDNWIFIDEEWYDLETINETYFVNIDKGTFQIWEMVNDEYLQFWWNENLTDVVRVKPEVEQYNAPVTLAIKVGTLLSGQEKLTHFYWIDQEIPGDPDNACNVEAIDLRYVNASIEQGETVTTGCVLNWTKGNPSGCILPPVLKWLYRISPSGGWTFINDTSSIDIDCNGDDCYKQNAVSGTVYTKTIRGIESDTYDLICKASTDYSGQTGELEVNDSTSPTISLLHPCNDETLNENITMNCLATDTSGMINISLWHNITGTWALNHTISAEVKNNGTPTAIMNFNDVTTNIVVGQNHNDTGGSGGGQHYFSTGKYGSGLHCNETSLAYNTTDNGIDFTNPFCVLYWIKPYYTYGSGLAHFFGINYYSSAENVYFGWDSTTTDIQFKLETGNNNGQIKTSGMSMNANTSYYLGFCAKDGNASIYLDGELVKSGVLNLPSNNHAQTYIGGWTTVDCDCNIDDWVFIPQFLDYDGIQEYYKRDNLSLEVEFNETIEGNYKYNCVGYDWNNLYGVSSTNYTFIVSNKVINMTLISPVNYYNSTSSNITLQCNFSSPKTLQNMSLYLNWTSWHLNDSIQILGSASEYLGEFNLTLPDGHYTWACFGEDTNGDKKWSTENWTFTIDGLNITINNPLNITYNSKPSLNYSIIGSPDKCWYKLQNESITHNLPNCINLSTIGGLGSNNLTILINDSLGNTDNETISWTYSTNPKVNLSSPTYGDVRYDENITFYWYYYDDVYETGTCLLSINYSSTMSGLSCTNGTLCHYTNRTWFYGSPFYWNVTCNNTHFNTTSLTYTYTVSKKNPDTGGTSISIPPSEVIENITEIIDKLPEIIPTITPLIFIQYPISEKIFSYIPEPYKQRTIVFFSTYPLLFPIIFILVILIIFNYIIAKPLYRKHKRKKKLKRKHLKQDIKIAKKLNLI